MKCVVVYGSMTGTTQAVAEDLAAILEGTAVAATEADTAALEGCDLLVLGLPPGEQGICRMIWRISFPVLRRWR
ncbi:hypothetical protein EGM51_13210 [Verrucomicrobia bacterium S94]|nr:hypothetical protein EGM51_13210 [Verrucomicrobia bacterium S94]